MDWLRIGNWDPFQDLGRLREQINSLFEQTISRAPGREPATGAAWTPAVDIYETEGEIVFHADLAGVSKDKIEVALDEDTLTISGVRPANEGQKFVRVERPKGDFRRTFTIGVPVEAAKVKATMREGVLEVVVPKAGKPKPEQVRVAIE
jgi:HSP20 family protein